jgi:hypothetical protein
MATEIKKLEIKPLIRPALAIIWSVAWIAIFLGTGEIPPEFVSGITATTVGWFFVSREIEKKK